MIENLHATTILTVKKNNEVILIADGQVTLGSCVMKATANKLREFSSKSHEAKKILVGFAGSTADAFTLFELLESKLDKHPNQLKKACVELTKDCRSDKILRRLDAAMIVVDSENSLVLTGNGDVLEPEQRIAAIGSGGNYAFAAAMALSSYENNLSAEQIAVKSMEIAANLCIYTNHNFNIKKINIDNDE